MELLGNLHWNFRPVGPSSCLGTFANLVPLLVPLPAPRAWTQNIYQPEPFLLTRDCMKYSTRMFPAISMILVYVRNAWEVQQSSEPLSNMGRRCRQNSLSNKSLHPQPTLAFDPFERSRRGKIGFWGSWHQP